MPGAAAADLLPALKSRLKKISIRNHPDKNRVDRVGPEAGAYTRPLLSSI